MKKWETNGISLLYPFYEEKQKPSKKASQDTCAKILFANTNAIMFPTGLPVQAGNERWRMDINSIIQIYDYHMWTAFLY